MPLSKVNKQVAVKALFAALLLSALAGVAGASLAPKLPLQVVLLYSVLGAVTLFAFLMVVTVATLTLVQFIMRKGGTDPQWFWFSAEPPGLVHLRAQARAAKTQATKVENEF